MDFQDTLMTNKWNQSFTTPDKNKNNITLQTNPSSNTFVSFNFSKSNILNESSQIASKQLISALKIQQKEKEEPHSYNSNQIEVLSNKITTKQISEFLQTKKLLSYYFNQYANMKIKQKMSKKKNKDLLIKVYDKQKEVARYREKVIKSIKSKQNMKKHYKSEIKLKKKSKINQFYQIKREIKIIDNQIESTITQIVELQKKLANKEEKQSARYSKGSLGQKKLQHKNNRKKLNKRQPIIYLPYYYPAEQQYPPNFGFAGNNNQYNNSLKSSTKRINVNPQANNEQLYQNDIGNFNSFGQFNKNFKNIPKNSKIATQNTQKITNKYNKQSVYPLGNYLNNKKIVQSKKSHGSVKWQGDQQDMDVIRMISESQKLKKSSQNREGIQQSVININMEASLQKTQNSIKQKNIMNKYQISPREQHQEKPLKQSNYNQKQPNKLSIYQLSPKKDQNFRQSSIHIDVDSDEHSRSNSYQDSAKDDNKKNKEKRVNSPPVHSFKNYQPMINKQYSSQFVPISQEQNSGISTPMFTGKQSPNLKLTNPIFQLENLVQSKAGEHKQQKRIKNQAIPPSPVNIQGINENSSDQSFMQISLQVQSKVSKQQFKNQSSAKSAVLKSKKQMKKQQKKIQEQQKHLQNYNQAQSEQNDSEDDFMDSINLLAVSRISKQQQKLSKSEDKNKQKQSQENIGAIDSQLRISNPSKIIKKGNPQFKQSNAKNSQKMFFRKIPMTVQQQDEYQEQVGTKKISTARNFNSEQLIASNIESEGKKGTI